MLASQTKYAIQALITLQSTSQEGYVGILQLAQQAGVPAPFLAKLINRLAAKKIVETKKGLNGGVRIYSGPNKVSFFDICVALDDPIIHDTCLLSKKSCSAVGYCTAHESWSQVRKKVISFLEKNILF